MKRSIPMALLLVLGACAYGFAQADKASQMHPRKPSSPMFDQIKTLAGEWEGKTSDGTVVRTSYRVVSNGSAVMNVLNPANEPEMVTMFHMDGASVMVTHYCSAGNQPRMVATSAPKPNVIAFAFKDVTNVAGPAEGHMSGLVLTLVDANHHQQEWIFRQDGKDQRDTFTFTRKK
jgi:hypothetical protein